MIIGLIIFSVLFLALALWRLDWALLVLIAALPAYLIRFTIFNLPLTLLEVMILISFAVWFFKNFLPGLKKLPPYPFSWEIILALIISFAAAGINNFSLAALGLWKAYFFEPVLLFILLLNTFKNKKDWRKIFSAFLVSAAGIALFAIYQRITGQFLPPAWAHSDPFRVTSFFSYPNAVGLYLAPLTMIFSGWLFYEIKEKTAQNLGRIILIISGIVVSFLAIWFAHSEGAMVGIMAGLVIFGILANKRLRIITLIIIALAVAATFSYPPLKSLILEKATLSDLSGKIKQQQWQETMKMLSGQKFFTGAGLDGYQAAVAPYHQAGIFFNRDHLANFDSLAYGSAALRAKYWQPVEIYLYPHNIFLNFWSELGLAGMLLFVWIMLKYLSTALILNINYNRERRSEKYLVLGLMAAMVAIIVHGLVDVPYFKNDLAAMFWALIALLSILNLNCRNERELK